MSARGLAAGAASSRSCEPASVDADAGGNAIGRFRYIAWMKCPHGVAGKASALRAGKRAPG